MRVKLNRTNIRKLSVKATRYEVTDAENTAFRLRVTPSGIKTFVVVYRNTENKLKRYTIGKFGDLTPEQAREIASKKLAEVKLGNDPAAEKQETRQQAEQQKFQTLRGFLDHKYGPWVVANRKDGKATLKRLEFCFSEFLDRELSDVNAWVVEKWRKDRLEQGRAPSTVNRDITALKACLSRAVDWDLIDKHPLAKVKQSREDHSGVVRFMDQAEETRLRAALLDRDTRIKQRRTNANQWRTERAEDPLPSLSSHAYGDHLTPMVLLSVNTGMRRGEVFTLQWLDVNFSGQSLAIRGVSTKSGKTRHIPLNTETLEVLRKWKDQQADTSGLVFPGREGKPFTNIKKSWARLLVDANITNFRLHDLRHTFASKLVMAGVDLNTVRELLGHSDIKMTLRYAHLAPEHKAAAVAKLVKV